MIDKKAKKKEKFYRKLVEELCENIEGLELDEDPPFKENAYVWRFNKDRAWIGYYETYEELAKDIMKHLKIEEIS